MRIVTLYAVDAKEYVFRDPVHFEFGADGPEGERVVVEVEEAGVLSCHVFNVRNLACIAERVRPGVSA